MKATAEQTTDQSAAEVAEEKITAIGEVEYTDVCKTKIESAREAYDTLTDSQKLLVTNYEILTMAETRYAELKAAAEQTADRSAAEVVEEKITAIGEVEFTDASKTKIEEAKKHIMALRTHKKYLSRTMKS